MEEEEKKMGAAMFVEGALLTLLPFSLLGEEEEKRETKGPSPLLLFLLLNRSSRSPS